MESQRGFLMVFQRLSRCSLAFSLSASTCLAQVPGYSRPAFDNQAGLIRRAQSGDSNAEYLLGVECEHGEGLPGGVPNLRSAISWYNMAVQRGDLRAMYHLGQLLVQGKALVPVKAGGFRSAPEQGNAMMQYALSRGYSPQTNSVMTPAMAARVAAQQQAAKQQNQATHPSSTTLTPDDAAGGLLLLGGLAALLAIAASSSSNGVSGNSPEPINGGKYCHIYKDVWVDDPGMAKGHYEQRYVPAQGYECP